MPWADSLVSYLWLGQDPRISTESEAWGCPTAWVLRCGWRFDPVPSPTAGCVASFVTHKGYGGNRLWMWQQLSGANWAVGVESSVGVHCEACHGIGRLCVSPWPRAIQKLAENIIRRCSSSSNTYIRTFERDICLPKGHFSVLRFFCVSLLLWLPTPYPDPHQRCHCTSSTE